VVISVTVLYCGDSIREEQGEFATVVEEVQVDVHVGEPRDEVFTLTIYDDIHVLLYAGSSGYDDFNSSAFNIHILMF
jgi:hypothetical protein